MRRKWIIWLLGFMVAWACSTQGDHSAEQLGAHVGFHTGHYGGDHSSGHGGTHTGDHRGMVPLAYEQEDLMVDLGVGLWAWPLPMDYDRDGDMDLVVSCPDVPFNGIYFFENREGSGLPFPVFEAPVKIGSGQKNFQLSMVDGEPRVLGRGVEYVRFRDSITRYVRELYPAGVLEKEFGKIRFSQWKYVDYEGDGDLDLIVGIDDWEDYGWDNAFDSQGKWTNGPLHGYVFLLENRDGEYVNMGKIMAGEEVLDVYGAPSPNMMDFDGDGDLDLICGEFLDRFTWFENTGSRKQPLFAPGRFLSNDQGILRMDLEMIIPVAVDWDGDGDADLVVGDEDGRVALVENTGEVADHMPVFRNPAYFRQKADLVKFGALVTPWSTDWDDDGDPDLICGNTAGNIGFIENLDGGNPPRWKKPVYMEAGGEVIRIMAGEKGSIQGPAEKKWGYTTLSVADWDMDGMKDLIVNSIWGKVVWYRNAGEKGMPRLEDARPVRVDSKGPAPKPAWNWWKPEPGELVTQWRTTPVGHDWNGDGLTDLVMLDADGYLCLYERYLKEGSLRLAPARRIFYGRKGCSFDSRNRMLDSTSGPLRLNASEAGGSGRRKFCLADWDLDGDLDLLVNSINISLFLNVRQEGDRVWFEHQGPLSSDTLAGHTTSPTTVDWDKNGRPDLIVGAEDGHLYYYQNESPRETLSETNQKLL